MTPDDRDSFLDGVRPAVFSTAMPHNRTHSILVWYMWDGAVFRVLTDRGSVKHQNVMRTGRATIFVHEDISYLSAEGLVEVRDPVTYEERLALWTRYQGEEVARQMVTPDSTAALVCLVLTPEKWIEVPAAERSRTVKHLNRA